jgi:hypothetical protein
VFKVSDLNKLDKEVIKGNDMNMDIVYEILNKMDAADSTEPDYERIRNNLFPKWSGRGSFIKFNRRVAAASITLFAMLLLSTSVLAAWVIYERIFTVEKVPTHHTPPFDTVDEMTAHIGENIMLPRTLPEGFTPGVIQGFDFITFKMRLITYENRDEQVALTIIYDFISIEDVLFSFPGNLADNADIEINGINIMQSQYSRMGLVSSYWEIDGALYMLTGIYTLDELAVIVGSLK